MKGYRPQLMKYVLVLVLPVILLSACTQTPQAAVDVSSLVPSLPVTQAMATPTDDPILEGIWFSLSNGPHATKFSCEDCHAGAETTGVALSWLNPVSGQRETVSTATELCAKCHPNQVAENPSPDLVLGVHEDFGCTNCHNTHNTRATCTGTGCHADVASILYAQIVTPANHPTSGDTNTHMCEGEACHNLVKQVLAEPIYHQPVHNEIPCYVCHDKTIMDVSRNSDGTWMTVIHTGQGSGAELQPVVSHVIGQEVLCEKCHFIGNPWQLTESVLPTDEGGEE